MSWDVFVQDLPAEARTAADIPEDFEPGPIGSRAEVISSIRAVVPFADFSNPAWGVIDGQDFSIEVNLGDEEKVMSLVLHVRGSALAAGVVADILEALGLRGL